jgi:hypothetical protein
MRRSAGTSDSAAASMRITFSSDWPIAPPLQLFCFSDDTLLNTMQKILRLLILFCVVGAAEAENGMEGLIRDAVADRQYIPALMRQLVSQRVYIIASLEAPRGTGIHIQDFIRNGRSFIPVFSDETHFRAETRGSGFEARGISIDGNLLASILKGDELISLNPGSSTPVDLNAKDLKAFVDHGRLPKGGI